MSNARVLVAGWLNSPHVVAWGDALLELGYEVHLAGQLVERWPAAPGTERFASVSVPTARSSSSRCSPCPSSAATTPRRSTRT